MPITLPDLPYASDELEPHMSRETLRLHHGKHHKAYVDKTNKLLAKTRLADRPLDDIVRATAGDPRQTELFNNAAQAWNHGFFWTCMAPGGGGAPGSALARLVAVSFGDLDGFKTKFGDAAEKHFGSGWAWLVADNGVLRVKTTPNADTPIASGEKPLLACDLWEHAYYLDFQNRRRAFVDSFLDELVNWKFVAEQLDKAMSTTDATA